jgi:hypothetical protein
VLIAPAPIELPTDVLSELPAAIVTPAAKSAVHQERTGVVDAGNYLANRTGERDRRKSV